jgi:hypothetical protein
MQWDTGDLFRTPRTEKSLTFKTVSSTDLCIGLKLSTLVIRVSMTANLQQDISQFVSLESIFQQLRNVQTKRHPSYRKSLQLPRAFVVLEAPCKPENISQLKIIEELFTPAVQMIDSVRTDQLIKEKVYTKWRTEQVHFCLAYEKA